MLNVERRQVYKRCVCKECRREFTITNGEREFYENNGLKLPVRCKECRDRIKAQRRTIHGI